MISGKEQQPAVMHVISSLNIGGAEMMLYRLLQRSNTSPSIVVSLTKGGELTAQIRKLNIEVIEIERTSLIQSLFLLQKIVKKFQPKVIQSWLYRADLLSLIISGKQKIPVIWNIRQTEVGRVKNQFHIWFIQRLNAKLSKMPHLIVYCANAAKLSHESIGYHSNHAVVIPNGVDTEKYDFNEQLRKQYREKWNIDPDEIVIGMIGRFDPLKNHARFCRIFRKVQEHFSEKSLKAMLVGRGINQENTELTKIGDNAALGSSKSKRSGSSIKALPIANICLSPPDNVPAFWRRRVLNLGNIV